MTSRDLAARFGVSHRTINEWVRRGVIPPARGGPGPAAYYDSEHVEAIQAWLALRHHFVSGAAAIAYCRENGITLAQYLRERESAVRDFGIGVA